MKSMKIHGLTPTEDLSLQLLVERALTRAEWLECFSSTGQEAGHRMSSPPVSQMAQLLVDSLQLGNLGG